MEEEIEQQEQPEEGQEPGISIVAGILGFFLCVILDAISVIPGAGDVEDIPAVIVLIVSFAKGVSPSITGAQAVAAVIKAIPALQILPAWTVAWGFIWYSTNHPSAITDKLRQAVELAGSIESGNVSGELSQAENAIEKTEEGASAVAKTAAEETQAGVQATERAAGKNAAASAASSASAEEEAGAGLPVGGNESEGEEGFSENQGDENKKSGEEDDLLPKEARDPMQNVAEDINAPEEDFLDGNEGSRKEEEDDEDEEGEGGEKMAA